MSTLVLPGSTIARVYFVIEPYPGAVYTHGEPHDQFTAALDAAADYWIGRRDYYTEQGLPERPPFPSVVERWDIVRPPDAVIGSVDMPISSDQLNEVAVTLSRHSRGLTS